jgi:hypothetical protein
MRMFKAFNVKANIHAPFQSAISEDDQDPLSRPTRCVPRAPYSAIYSALCAPKSYATKSTSRKSIVSLSFT